MDGNEEGFLFKDLEVSQTIVEELQATLGSLITKPKIQSKYLERPPFPFLHGVITEVLSVTGFAQGLYTTEEISVERLQDKYAKVVFLSKIIDCTAFALAEKMDVQPKKIVAGLEVDKTLTWLLRLHCAATTCGGERSEEAVKHVLSSVVEEGVSKRSRTPRSKTETESENKGEKKASYLPNGWVEVPSKRRPGEFSYVNSAFGKRVATAELAWQVDALESAAARMCSPECRKEWVNEMQREWVQEGREAVDQIVHTEPNSPECRKEWVNETQRAWVQEGREAVDQIAHAEPDNLNGTSNANSLEFCNQVIPEDLLPEEPMQHINRCQQQHQDEKLRNDVDAFEETTDSVSNVAATELKCMDEQMVPDQGPYAPKMDEQMVQVEEVSALLDMASPVSNLAATKLECMEEQMVQIEEASTLSDVASPIADATHGAWGRSEDPQHADSVEAQSGDSVPDAALNVTQGENMEVDGALSDEAPARPEPPPPINDPPAPPLANAPLLPPVTNDFQTFSDGASLSNLVGCQVWEVSLSKMKGVERYGIAQADGRIKGLGGPENLVVKRVDAGGLLDLWNQAHPHMLVQRLDRIISVNGKSTIEEMQKELRLPSVHMQLARYPTRFKIEVVKQGRKLGFRFEKPKQEQLEQELYITEILEDGCLADHNEEQIFLGQWQFVVLPGMRVDRVNGKHQDVFEMIEELKRCENLNLQLCRTDRTDLDVISEDKLETRLGVFRALKSTFS